MGTLNDSNIWQEIPDTLLLDIFQYLDFKHLIRSSAVCKKWQRVALDESLWKKLVRKRWGLKGTELAPGKDLWYNEYKRFYYHTPLVESEVLKQHTDEVLDVAFSHNGRYICTTSKDCTVKVWELGFPTRVKYDADLKKMFGWSLTQYAVFNQNDRFLLVCGVNLSGEFYNEFLMGHGVVFDMTNGFCVVRVMGMNPPHLFADWADTNICLGGFATDHEYLTINSFKISEEKNKQSSRPPDPEVIMENNDGQKLCVFYANCNHTMNLLVADVPNKTCDISKNDKNIDKNCNAQPENSKTSKYLILVAGVHDCIIIHKLNNVQTTEDFDEANAVRPPTYEVIRRPGQYISGMKLSHDHRYLYFNYRQAEPSPDTDEEDYMSLKENIEVNVIDLQTRQVLHGISYTGHKGFSEYPAWYICLDISEDIVGSGSEEAKAYLWDKHYRCLITTLQHKEGVVNGLEFNPKDKECLVTSGDDHTVRIWRSRNRMKSLKRKQTETQISQLCDLQLQQFTFQLTK